MLDIFSMTRVDPIRIGVLHSASGTMALNETSLRDVILMEVERVNAVGGVLGRQIEPVVVDPGSDWMRYRDMAHALVHEFGVAAIFGCWTSVSRKSVLPVIEHADSLLFYPMQYEGEEQSPNVFYLGATPNQQAIPALEFLMSAAAAPTAASSSSAPTTSTRARRTASCAPSCRPRACRSNSSRSTTSRSATTTGASRSRR